MHINQTGQAFSVFKLLIAAIVAVVILGILLNILNIIPGLGQNNPNSEAATLLKNIAVNPASIQTSQPIQFNATNNNLNARAIATQADYVVQQNQICVFPGEFENDEIFTDEGGEGKSLTYVGGSSAVNAAIKGICDRGDSLVNTLEEFVVDERLLDAAEQCPCSEGGESGDYSGQCCVMVLIRQ